MSENIERTQQEFDDLVKTLHQTKRVAEEATRLTEDVKSTLSHHKTLLDMHWVRLNTHGTMVFDNKTYNAMPIILSIIALLIALFAIGLATKTYRKQNEATAINAEIKAAPIAHLERQFAFRAMASDCSLVSRMASICFNSMSFCSRNMSFCSARTSSGDCIFSNAAFIAEKSGCGENSTLLTALAIHDNQIGSKTCQFIIVRTIEMSSFFDITKRVYAESRHRLICTGDRLVKRFHAVIAETLHQFRGKPVRLSVFVAQLLKRDVSFLRVNKIVNFAEFVHGASGGQRIHYIIGVCRKSARGQTDKQEGRIDQ